VLLDIRFIPEDSKTILNKLKSITPKGFSLKVVAFEPALFVNEDNSYITKLRNTGEKILNKKIAFNRGQGSSDARHYTRVGNAAVEFGPRGGGMGSDDEWVDIQSLEQYCKILEEFLLSLE
jgi:acetylornithine deacetylase/succinyl-diaminopimelate desuccinylase-like protein